MLSNNSGTAHLSAREFENFIKKPSIQLPANVEPLMKMQVTLSEHQQQKKSLHTVIQSSLALIKSDLDKLKLAAGQDPLSLDS
mmetsp:Transcript_41818/g.63926  ORF Transcript_41818/g.63926 Transcript_41818/m.63926 type:complete len:83 (+) Transcript_41818:215-463(+)